MRPILRPLVFTLALLSLIPFFSFGQIQFTRHGIASPDQPADLFTSDVDSDGDLDILVVSGGNGGSLTWYKNNGSQEFTTVRIASGFAGPRSVRAGDIDLDGDTDIIAVALGGNKISWWENDGAGDFVMHDVVTGWTSPHTVELCDLDQDMDIDILCCQFDMSENMSEVVWWENDGSQNWLKHVVSSRFQQSTFIYGADMDNDGDNDLIACGELNGEIYWWENDGEQVWTEHMIDGQISKIHTILPRDFDKDGDLDILAHACTSGLQAWYENKGDGDFKKYPMENLPGAIWMDCADFDLDGDYDLAATGMGNSNLVCYENDGRQGLTHIDLPGGITSGFALNISDLDGDGDEDIVAIGLNSNTLAWWENTVERTSFLDAPKWLCSDKERGLVYISNEESGSVVRMDETGFQRCIRNNLPICTGMTMSDGFLWVASGTSLLQLNPDNGETKSNCRIPGQFLQGLDSDEEGYLYVSDPLSGIVFKVDEGTGQSSALCSGLEYPSSVFFDSLMDKIIILDGEGPVLIKSIDKVTGHTEVLEETRIAGGGDIAGDGTGNHYISCPGQNSVYAVTNNFEDPLYLYAEGLSSPTGLIYLEDEGKLAYLSPTLNQLEFIDANATGINQTYPEGDNQLKAYPNPFSDVLNVSFPTHTGSDAVISIIDGSGRVKWSKEIQEADNGIIKISQYQFPSFSRLENGLYLITVTSASLSLKHSIIKIN